MVAAPTGDAAPPTAGGSPAPAPATWPRRVAGALWAAATVLAVLVAVLLTLLLLVSTGAPKLLSLALLACTGLLLVAALRDRRRARRLLGVWAGLLAVAATAVWASQAFASTAPILGADGQGLPNSIATLEKVVLNGSEQWITVRGKDRSKPVLLYLGIGGPGAGGFPANVTSLGPLEEHFVVVNWDQPGTGKSYGAVPIRDLTVERIVDDAHDLTELLRARFGQEKIYLMGLSWGTILGTKLVDRYPELYHAYLGMGQMVNTTENDRIGYDVALRVADERGDEGTGAALRRNGPPPYTGDGMALKYAAYNNVLFDHMGNARLEVVLLLVPQLAREYGFVDRLNFDRGLVESFTALYPQLADLDFTTEAAEVEVPMFFLVGRNDVNAVAALVQRYHDLLEAPHKEIIWLDSGHGAGAEEIRDAMLNHVLPVAQDGAR
jgi:pimeloyl-ACP methyl ester carboxylesterase